VSDPFPEPNSNLPINMTGSMADVPFSKAPAAKTVDPKTHRNENRNTPTTKKYNKIYIY